MHGGSKVRPVGEKLNREPFGNGNSRRNGDPFPSKQSLRGVRPLAHQPGEQIPLNGEKLASICLDLDHDIKIECGLHNGVSRAKPGLKSGPRHIELAPCNFRDILDKPKLLREYYPAD